MSRELLDFVSAPDSAFAWTSVDPTPSWMRIELKSQEWQGSVWRHSIAMALPANLGETAILYITGGDPNPLDLDEARRLADSSGLAVAMLFHIPNQPLYGLIEDALIAESFVRFLDTGDSKWPLLFPMAKAAIRAMDAVEAATEGQIRRFVVTGASKRGWTAWLAAATGDPRIVGIAPQVFDNLNVRSQLLHQVETWGEPSEMILDYTSRGLHEQVGTAEGQRLVAMVDPYSYRDRLTIPKLILNGANDPYWAVDALGRYWDDLPDPKWACVVPNAGHGTNDDGKWAAALSAFAIACSGGPALPQVRWSLDSKVVKVSSTKPFPRTAQLWVAESDNLDFRSSRWSVRLEAGSAHHKGNTWESTLVVPPSSRNRAVLAELSFPGGGQAFTLTTPAVVLPA